MNIRTYIILGLIGLSAGGIQGSWYSSCCSRLTPMASCLSSLVQKLTPYRYHIGGALVIAGVLYGQYRTYQTWKNSCNISQQDSHDSCEIIYEFNLGDSIKNLPKSIEIKSILHNGKRLTRDGIKSSYWSTKDGKCALDNFVQGVKACSIHKRDTVRFVYGSDVHTVERWDESLDVHEIARSLLIPCYMLKNPGPFLSIKETLLPSMGGK